MEVDCDRWSVCCQPVIESAALITCCVLGALRAVLANKAGEKSAWRVLSLNGWGILISQFQVETEFFEGRKRNWVLMLIDP